MCTFLYVSIDVLAWMDLYIYIIYIRFCICLMYQANTINVYFDNSQWVLLMLIHWGWVMHICVNKLSFIDSDNGLSPSRNQAVNWTNARILLIWHLGIHFSKMLIKIHAFLFKKMHFKTSSAKWWPFCFTLDVLNDANKRSWVSVIYNPTVV